MKALLIATDLSARSDRALQRAIALAREFNAKLDIVHVIDAELPERAVEPARVSAVQAIEGQLTALQPAAAEKFDIHIVQGEASSEVLRLAADLSAELIVLGIHRHTSRELFRGTTAEQILRAGRVPTLVVKDVVNRPYRRVLVAVDMSVPSIKAIGFACSLAPAGEVILVHATHAPFVGFLGPDTIRQIVQEEQEKFAGLLAHEVKELTTRLGTQAPHFETVLEQGEVRQVIRDGVDRTKPDFLAIGTRGRSGLVAAILGSVAEDLLSDAPVDVVAAPSV